MLVIKIGFQIFIGIKNLYQRLSSQRDLGLPNHWQNPRDSENTYCMSFFARLLIGSGETKSS